MASSIQISIDASACIHLPSLALASSASTSVYHTVADCPFTPESLRGESLRLFSQAPHRSTNNSPSVDQYSFQSTPSPIWHSLHTEETHSFRNSPIDFQLNQPFTSTLVLGEPITHSTCCSATAAAAAATVTAAAPHLINDPLECEHLQAVSNHHTPHQIVNEQQHIKLTPHIMLSDQSTKQQQIQEEENSKQTSTYHHSSTNNNTHTHLGHLHIQPQLLSKTSTSCPNSAAIPVVSTRLAYSPPLEYRTSSRANHSFSPNFSFRSANSSPIPQYPSVQFRCSPPNHPLTQSNMLNSSSSSLAKLASPLFIHTFSPSMTNKMPSQMLVLTHASTNTNTNTNSNTSVHASIVNHTNNNNTTTNTNNSVTPQSPSMMNTAFSPISNSLIYPSYQLITHANTTSIVNGVTTSSPTLSSIGASPIFSSMNRAPLQKTQYRRIVPKRRLSITELHARVSRATNQEENEGNQMNANKRQHVGVAQETSVTPVAMSPFTVTHGNTLFASGIISSPSPNRRKKTRQPTSGARKFRKEFALSSLLHSNHNSCDESVDSHSSTSSQLSSNPFSSMAQASAFSAVSTVSTSTSSAASVASSAESVSSVASSSSTATSALSTSVVPPSCSSYPSNTVISSLINNSRSSVSNAKRLPITSLLVDDTHAYGRVPPPTPSSTEVPNSSESKFSSMFDSSHATHAQLIQSHSSHTDDIGSVSSLESPLNFKLDDRLAHHVPSIQDIDEGCDGDEQKGDTPQAHSSSNDYSQPEVFHTSTDHVATEVPQHVEDKSTRHKVQVRRAVAPLVENASTLAKWKLPSLLNNHADETLLNHGPQLLGRRHVKTNSKDPAEMNYSPSSMMTTLSLAP